MTAAHPRTTFQCECPRGIYRVPSPSGKSGKNILHFSSQGKVREFDENA